MVLSSRNVAEIFFIWQASPKKKNSADTDRHRDAGTRNGSRKSGASSSKSKSAKHPKLEITPKTKETPKKRKLNDDGGSDADDDDKEGSAHKRRKASSSVEPRPKASARASIGNGASYLAYLNREPPRHLGEKDHPEGSPGCLKNCTIVMTGMSCTTLSSHLPAAVLATDVWRLAFDESDKFKIHFLSHVFPRALRSRFRGCVVYRGHGLR